MRGATVLPTSSFLGQTPTGSPSAHKEHTMRKSLALGFLAASLAGFAAPASAEDTTVIRRDSAPGVSVERREGVVERREVTTGSVDCGSKTVHKEDGMGNSKTVHKEGCN
jgi:hypothetical protein